MHSISLDGTLVPDRCSGYPFCDVCAPPRPKCWFCYKIGVIELTGLDWGGGNVFVCLDHKDVTRRRYGQAKG